MILVSLWTPTSTGDLERPRDRYRNCDRLLRQLDPRDPDHHVAGQRVGGVTLAIVLERLAVAVELIAVDFDDQLAVRPQEVGLVPATR